ncbi:MAG: sulfatase [Segetibacter sp.]
MYKLTILVLLPLLLIFFCCSHKNIPLSSKQKESPKYNVLFVMVDDLRPELGCYGNSRMHTPNIDMLAAEGTLFKNQFVTVPTCGPSRASLLTGMLPRTQTDLSNDVLEVMKKEKIKSDGPESFVEHLRRNGYYTVGIGKISHSPDGYIYKYLQPKSVEPELPDSWDEMLFDPGKWGTGWNAFFGYSDGSNRNELKGKVKPYESADVTDESYPDGLTANLAEQKLKELAEKDQPFFLSVGFFKPHLPFNAPKKYWDMYNEAEISLTPSPNIPQNIDTASLHESGEFNAYKLGDEKASLSKPVSDDYARKLRHAYYASVSYVDAQIGKVLAELKKLNLDKNTIIVLWGDHGWHLGDDRIWGKHTITEWAVRSPLIVKAPGMLKASSSDKIISSIDIYPSLMELCGIKMPHQTDGKSFVSLLKDPKNEKWNNVAYSYYRNGITVRTDRYRFTKYFRPQEPVTELYDHENDPYEYNNIAGSHPKIVKRLMPICEKGNTGLYIKTNKGNNVNDAQ